MRSPHTAQLGRIRHTDTYRDVTDHPTAETFSGLVIYRFDAPLFFANAGGLRDDIVGAIDDSVAPVFFVVIDAESIYDIDSSGAQVMLELLDILDKRGVGLGMARVRTEVFDELQVSGIRERLAEAGIYFEVDDAVGAFLEMLGRHDWEDREPPGHEGES